MALRWLLLLELAAPVAARKYKYFDYKHMADELHDLAKARALRIETHPRTPRPRALFPLTVF